MSRPSIASWPLRNRLVRPCVVIADPAAGPAGAGESPAPAGPTAGPAITTQSLTKRFRSGQLAVDGLDMVVPRGSVYGFLGPNGSGKTTTIRMLLGLVFPTTGSHELLGTAMPGGSARVLPQMGSLVEGPAFYPQLSGRANLARIDTADATADPHTADPLTEPPPPEADRAACPATLAALPWPAICDSAEAGSTATCSQFLPMTWVCVSMPCLGCPPCIGA